jgi:hypothetical protein
MSTGEGKLWLGTFGKLPLLPFEVPAAAGQDKAYVQAHTYHKNTVGNQFAHWTVTQVIKACMLSFALPASYPAYQLSLPNWQGGLPGVVCLHDVDGLRSLQTQRCVKLGGKECDAETNHLQCFSTACSNSDSSWKQLLVGQSSYPLASEMLQDPKSILNQCQAGALNSVRL